MRTKLLATELAVWASTEAVKNYGAYGLLDELPVEQYFRVASASTIAGGTSNMVKLTIVRELLDVDATKR